uniref:Uncharacterized protein n=1 Tax=Opuntia streptacantha TaxID=393608 RepID=A0A7C9DM52_OPUST
MLVKKPVRRNNGRNQALGQRIRGHEQGELNPGRSRRESSPSWPRGELNRPPPSQESAPNTASAQQQINRDQDQNCGSRFRALATFDLNMDMETPDMEVAAEGDSVPN